MHELSPGSPVEDVGCHARRRGHVAVEALAVGQQRGGVEQLAVAGMRLGQRLHRLQQRVAAQIACAHQRKITLPGFAAFGLGISLSVMHRLSMLALKRPA